MGRRAACGAAAAPPQAAAQAAGGGGARARGSGGGAQGNEEEEEEERETYYNRIKRRSELAGSVRVGMVKVKVGISFKRLQVNFFHSYGRSIAPKMTF